MNNAASLISIFHIWSTKRNLQPSAVQHPAIHCYHEKSSATGDFDPYSDVKKKYIDDRGIPWCLSNKRPDRLREVLHEVEELLQQHFIVTISWKSSRNFQIVLSNGVILAITIAIDSPDIERLIIDKSLVGKLVDHLYDGVVGEGFMLFTFAEKHKALLVNCSKRLTKEVSTDKKDGDKLSSFDLKLSLIKLPGSGRRGLKKNVTSNKALDMVCIWWTKTNLDAATPWSPASIDEDRANIVLFSITGISSVYTVDMVTYTSAAGELLDCSFSWNHHCQLLTLEQYEAYTSKRTLEACIYEMNNRKLLKVAVTSIPCPGRLICQSRNHAQNRIALAYDNHQLCVWDEYQKKSTIINISMICTSISWHPSDSMLLIASSTGEMQIYDLALNCLHLQLLGDNIESSNLRLSQFFFTPPRLKNILWSCDYGLTSTPDSCCCCDDILIVFERGPLCMLRIELGVCSQGLITPVEIVCAYIKYNQSIEAVSLLSKLNWNTSGVQCFHLLTLITTHLFKLPFNAKREACLEDTLGTFYAPVRPLSENTILEYRDEISRVARRFFHLLLRYKRFEKAYLLAIDIGSKDLFMDIHYLATDVQNFDLANASQQRAYEIHERENNQGLNGIPSNYLNDDLNDNSMNQLRMELNQVDLSNSNTRLNSTLIRPTSSLPIMQYDFNDSADEQIEDPVAWALASRTGQIKASLEKKQGQEKADKKIVKTDENLHLVHFGHV